MFSISPDTIESKYYDLDAAPQWVRTVSPVTKIPDWNFGRYTRNAPELTADDVVGIVTSFELPYIVVDIDDTTTRPEIFPATYEEISGSGNGLHLIYLLNEPKNNRLRKVLKAPSPGDWVGEIKYGDNAFTIITGNLTKDSFPKNNFTILNHQQLLKYMLPTTTPPPTTPPRGGLPEDRVQAFQNRKTVQTTFSLEDLRDQLRKLPLNQTPDIMAAWEKVTQTKYQHYDYWITVGMAIHYETNRLGVPDEGAAMFLEWSQKDLAGFRSKEDVLNHYNSLSPDADRPVRGATLKALVDANKLKFQYFNHKNGMVDANNPDNIIALLNYYDLNLYDGGWVQAKDSINPYLVDKRRGETPQRMGYTGPFSSAQLTIALDRIAHLHGMRGRGMEMKIFKMLEADKQPPPDWLRIWWNTPPHLLPEQLLNNDNVLNPKAQAYSTFDTVAQAFKLNDNEELGLKLLKKQFFQLVKMHSNRRDEPNEGFLILTGKQASHKTSFFELWIPKYLDSLFKIDSPELSDEKGSRDFIRSMEVYALINYDECDYILNSNNKSASRMKAYLSGQKLSSTRIYEKEDTEMRRMAVLVGTTNETRLKLPDTGTRRFWILDVDNIDTYSLNPKHSDFSWYHFYRSMVKEFEVLTAKGQRPWLLTPDEADAVTEYNRRFTAMSTADEEILQLLENERIVPIDESKMFEAIGNMDGTGWDTQVVRQKNIRDMIRGAGGYPVKPPELRRALEFVACAYLGGRRGTIKIKGRYDNIITWKDGLIITNDQTRGYLLPPLKPELRGNYGRPTQPNKPKWS